MIEPYYNEDGVRIFCGDCREVFPELGRFDLLLTDPPYGLNRDGQKASTGSHGGRKPYPFNGWDDEAPSRETFKMLLQATGSQIIWGANYFSDRLPAGEKWLVWDKGQRIYQSDCELAWTSFNGALRIFTRNRVDLQRDGAVHPTQKPLSLMSWCLIQAGAQGTVLDPFMGSGTTLVAAKLRGLQATGIELNKDYCDMAVERLRQRILIPA